MAELRPYPIGALVTRVFRELEERGSVFDLPRRRFFTGESGHDLSVRFHGARAATPLGPAAGPQSQMAQNLVLSWLAGCRILELKTVQIDDELEIPRPCIDMQTVGYNVEWSQELKLEQSLEEYVKGSMLIEMLVASGALELAPGAEDTIFDMSVGYDLAGIRTERVQAFVRGMLDASEVVERLRAQIPPEYAHFRELDFTTRLSDTLTLSTFHGCPPDEIERMIEFLLEENGLHCVVKLNPMLLGPERARELLHERMGYVDVHIPDSAFERDTSWEQAVAFTDRLGQRARELGLGFGVKFSNTLIVTNHRDFFPAAEEEMYLSGPPLHVLAMDLVRRFRGEFGDRFPVSFSAGIDRKNFPDAVALGLVPITVCSDLLKPGGYGRAKGYLDELVGRMDAVGARDLDAFVRDAYGPSGDRLTNTEHYVAGLEHDPRYGAEANAKVPRKIGSKLELFDCISCDKCVPVCPNDANFSLRLPTGTIPVHLAAPGAHGRITTREAGTVELEQKSQWANFADFCNDCGNCDVFCPEDGGPYLVKPRFFGSLDDWKGFEPLDGFHVAGEPGASEVHARIDGTAYRLASAEGRTTFAGEGFELAWSDADPLGTLEGRLEREVDLTPARLLERLRDAVFAEGGLSYPALLANRT